MRWIRHGGLLSKECMMELLSRTRDVLAREPNVLRVEGGAALIGDIHG